jgi:hypothetical protein
MVVGSTGCQAGRTVSRVVDIVGVWGECGISMALWTLVWVSV